MTLDHDHPDLGISRMTSSSCSFVSSVSRTLASIAWPVRGVRARRAAVREVAILNRDSELIRYHLVGDDLRADLELPAGPFVPRHPAECTSMFQATLARAKGGFAARTGGST